LREVLNEENTLFCPSKDIQAWADALRYLLENPQICQKMGTHARSTALQYTWLKRTISALEGFEKT
jgi:glycosyltransferase involved in cell wall biosynthesis